MFAFKLCFSVGGRGEEGGGKMALHYVGLTSFLLGIFEGRVVGILMAGNRKVKTWA